MKLVWRRETGIWWFVGIHGGLWFSIGDPVEPGEYGLSDGWGPVKPWRTF